MTRDYYGMATDQSKKIEQLFINREDMSHTSNIENISAVINTIVINTIARSIVMMLYSWRV